MRPKPKSVKASASGRYPICHAAWYDVKTERVAIEVFPAGEDGLGCIRVVVTKRKSMKQ